MAADQCEFDIEFTMRLYQPFLELQPHLGLMLLFSLSFFNLFSTALTILIHNAHLALALQCLSWVTLKPADENEQCQ